MGKDETVFEVDRFDGCYRLAKLENVGQMLYWSLGLIYDLMSPNDMHDRTYK